MSTNADATETGDAAADHFEPSTSPLVSVIVYSRDNHRFVKETLTSLQKQTLFNQIEVLFPDGSASGAPSDLLAAFPWLRHIPLPNSSMPELKGTAIEAAASETIAILDPGSIAPADWIEKLLRGFGDDSTMAVGGAVAFSSAETAANLAAYLFEYCAFNPPVPPGPTSGDLAGNSVAYRRSQLTEDCADLLATERFYKPFFHDRMRALGGNIVLLSDLIVEQRTEYKYFAFAMRRGHFGRCFAARRLKHCSTVKRAFLRIFAPLAPLIVIARTVPKVFAHPDNRRMFSKAWLPLIGVCVSWGVGEWIGYWFGAGNSCGKLY